jgi:cation-transporting ATPase 13A3/4/5
MFPKPTKFKFYEDSFKFILILGAVAVVGYLCLLPIFIIAGINTQFFILRGLDLITITIPPTLPLAMTIGTSFAISRLKTKGVVCISPPAVNVAGKVTIMCFDKTGTLTEGTMQLKGIEEAGKLLTEGAKLSEAMSRCLATCHSLTYFNSQLQGDSQELAIYKRSGWVRSENAQHRVAYVKEGRTLVQMKMFHFTSYLKRMGVIVKEPESSTCILYVKGAPEEVLKKCKAVPDDVSARVLDYSRQGLRVLACGFKTLSVMPQDCTLTDVEDDLTLLGLIVLENQLKPETCHTIDVLQTAKVRCIVSTGDSVLTGVAVAQKAGITPSDVQIYIGEVKEGKVAWESLNGQQTEWRAIEATTNYRLAVTGAAFTLLQKEASLIEIVLEKSDVFGRMSPVNKASLVEALQSPEVTVGMCGDGANDCSALRTADVGVAVSEAEASIAAPFSGKSLWCVTEVLREGKCALSTSFQCFKFMALYSMIQFMSAFTLYQMQNSLVDTQYLYIDLITILPLAVFISYTASYHLLTPDSLPNSLLASTILFQVIGQILIQALFLGLAVMLLVTRPWYSSDTGHIMTPASTYENTTVFLVSSVQYVVVSLAFSSGPPFRQPTYKNYYYTATAIILATFDLYLLLTPDTFFLGLFQLESLDLSYKLMLFSIITCNSLVTLLFDWLSSSYVRPQAKL